MDTEKQKMSHLETVMSNLKEKPKKSIDDIFVLLSTYIKLQLPEVHEKEEVIEESVQQKEMDSIQEEDEIEVKAEESAVTVRSRGKNVLDNNYETSIAIKENSSILLTVSRKRPANKNQSSQSSNGKKLSKTSHSKTSKKKPISCSNVGSHNRKPGRWRCNRDERELMKFAQHTKAGWSHKEMII